MKVRFPASLVAMPYCYISAFLRTLIVGALFTNTLQAAETHNVKLSELQHQLENIGLAPWLLELNGDIYFAASEVTTANSHITDIKVPARINQQNIEVENATFNVLDGTVSVDLTLRTLSNTFDADIRANHLVISKQNASSQAEPANSSTIFSHQVLIPSWLPDLNGRIITRLSQITFQNIDFATVSSELHLNESQLDMKFSATSPGSELQADIVHQYSGAHTKVLAQGRNTPLHLIAPTDDYLRDVAIDFDMSLNTRGQSLRAFAESMSGELGAETTDGTINIEELNKLSQDILSLTLSSLIPISLESRDNSQDTAIECAALKLMFQEGVAMGEKMVALRTNNLAIMGGGTIDFAEENIDITMLPHARSASKLKSKSAIKRVSLRGPFQDIEVKPELAGLINQGISLTTKIATFGLSTLRLPLLDWAAANDMACMATLDQP